MATQYDPIAKDASLNTTETPPRNLADVIAQSLAALIAAMPATVLNNLADVVITLPTDGQTLKYDSVSQKWVNADDAGGHTIIDPDGQDMPQRASMQFLDAEVTDDAVNEVTKISMMPASYPASRVTLENGSSVEDIIGKASGSGLANSLVYREEITEITAEMWANIANGSFKGLHAGIHYTASSGRTYWFADADYFFGGGDTEQTNHHFLVIEDEINHTAAHHTTNTTVGGAASSDIYATTLPAYQSELEADFGASHIKEVRLQMSNAVANGMPSGWAWAGKKSFIPNMPMVFGHYLHLTGNTGEMYNGGNRVRQCALFQAMPETIISRLAATQARQWWWTDDVASASNFGDVHYYGNAYSGGASNAGGVRRAFIIG